MFLARLLLSLMVNLEDITALAVKNIEVNFMFLARLLLSLH